MDTPKRKRRRLESSRSRRHGRKASSSSSSANRTPGSAGSESKIVWKDSPADKQIKVSGTGKMAVRREMQGFVGRLARASQYSPASSSDEEKKRGRDRVRTRKKALEDEEKAASRHLMFSPPVVEADPFDDLTDESWALLDQLQSQRAPVEASQAQSQSQTEFVSSQNLALTPRPMPSAYSEPKKPPVLPPSSSTSVVDRDVVNRSLLLRLLDDQDAQLEAMLNGDCSPGYSGITNESHDKFCILGLVECGLNEEEALFELQKVIGDFQSWLRKK
eukprot:jgi/Phyca11/16500/fgenesh1_pg.PHYCAscaffold_20_\